MKPRYLYLTHFKTTPKEWIVEKKIIETPNTETGMTEYTSMPIGININAEVKFSSSGDFKKYLKDPDKLISDIFSGKIKIK